MGRNSLNVDYINKNNIKELLCSKTNKMLPILEFRIHKGYYMSYCKDWEREDNRKRSQARIWKTIKLNEDSEVYAKTTRMKDSILVSSSYTNSKLYFDKEIGYKKAIEAFNKYTKIYHDITYEYK